MSMGSRGAPAIGAWDFDQDKPLEIDNSYTRPPCSRACFIQAIDDDLMSIFELVKTEARIFKYGSGTGTNFSRLRQLPRAALQRRDQFGADELPGSAGPRRRWRPRAAARRAGRPRWSASTWTHPEISDFINWKVKEEEKARILIGARRLRGRL